MGFENRSGYDIYFLDIEMEGINGIELAVEIRRRNASCEIFLSVSMKVMSLIHLA